MSGRLIEIIKGIIDNTVRKRKIILALSCIVVFVTTYMLILPAITLDLKSASEQGGIDIGAASEEIEENDEEPQEPEEAGEENPPESAADAEDSGSGEEDVKDEKAPEVSSESREKKSGADNAQPQDLSFEGKGFSVTLKDVEGVLPEGTELTAEEILEDDERYGDYYKDALDAYCRETGNDDIEGFDFARFYDISLINGSEKIEPDKGTVNVSISYDKDDKRNKGDNALRVDSKENIHIIHFAEDAESGKVKAELLDSESVGVSVSKDRLEEAAFETDSFSVYAIVNAPEPAQASGWVKVTSLEEIVEHGTEAAGGLYMRQKDGCYFTNKLSGNVGGYANRTGITKTKPYKNSPDEASELGAVPYYFEQTEAPDKFKVYCYTDDSKQYVKQSGNSLSFVTDKNNATAFKISAFEGSQDNFRVEGSNNYCWNQQGNYSGVAFAAFNDLNDVNARMQFEYYRELEKDPYKLNGKTYGIAYHDDNVNAAALTDQPGSTGRLAGSDLVMKPDVISNDGILLVSGEIDLTEWTFECIEGDYYHIKTSAGYLTINEGTVTVEAEPDPVFSKIKAVPGTGANSGKWHFTVNGRSLNLPDTSAAGFNTASGSGVRTWMNLVEKTTLSEEDFQLYSAKKVSVSDTNNVYDGQQVVIYTRVWNDNLKKYEFYVVDHDGSLVKAEDTGDGIEWTGSQVNTALWTFVEYKEGGSPTYFYELRNVQYGNYIDPKNGAEGEELLTDSTVGINLNGRRYGENYTTIIAWDEEHYSYSGIKAGDGKIEGCRLNEAEDFYFAVIELHDPGDELSTVNTIDSKQYGITMKMIDFNNGNAGSGPSDTRDAKQKEYFGGDNNNPGLLSTDLQNGYPVSTNKTPQAGRPLNDLFTEDGLSEVNHLFIESIYNESGYFEYNSTSNFAHLNDDGTFTVYDQLGNISDYNKPTNQHGQFMPYDNIVAGQYSPYTNQTNVLGKELPDLDPRKGEKIYGLGTRANVDYHFGMEMEAGFTQTANGKDAWGHDIVFEFSGDDDFWFYVDGELVLDLGGVHSAMTGSINFRTGQVKSSRGDSNLYEIFSNNYEKRGLPEEEIEEKLSSIFVLNEEGNYVFSDYSNHTMKMFYMERGAGASNLHMRFNLAAVKPGTVELSKKLSGTENPSNSLIEFPYQIWYKSPTLFGNEDYHRLGELPGDPERVTYKDTITQVKYEESFTPSGGTVPYEEVFFLKAGQTAVIDLPESTMDYYIVECGIDPGVYDHVYVNTSAQDEHEVEGEPTENYVGERARCDYPTEVDTVKGRPKVDYTNHVNEKAVRTLTINKWLYDTNGQDRLHYSDNKTEFTFRLYLGSENDDPDKLPLANMYEYHVKDPYGNYCTWSSDDQKFVSLDKTEYSALTDEEKELAKFTTSMYGAISRIPADFTVEVRDLIAGLQYKVEERQNQIPKGYTLRQIDGYERIDEDHYINNKDVPISGVMQANQDPAIRVNNQKGWGLSVEKKWTDADFMEIHNPIYFAVYLKDEHSETGIADEPVAGTIRQLTTDKTSVYYYFDHLEQGRKFEDYVIREVIVEPLPAVGKIVVDNDGVVTSCGTVTPIDDGGKLNIGGKRIGGEYQRDGFEYTVSYKVGEPTLLNENVRTDTVTNSMPGIELYKTDWEGKPLAGAVFTLKDQDGKDVAAESYTSGEDGLITTAYLPVGTYTLEETAAPNGYMTLDGPATITVSEDEEGKTTVEISGIDESMYDIDTDGSAMAATIHIKNRTPSLEVKKYDASNKEPIEGVHFALYLQVTDSTGKKVKDYQPINGYEDISTDESGVLPGLTMKLGRNTYYLTEKQPQEGYDPLPGDLCFTIGADGKFRIVTSEEEGADPAWAAAGIDPSSWLKIDPSSAPADADGKVIYTLEIPNSKEKKVSFKKVDIANIEQPLKGAEFELYETVDGQRKETPLIAGLVSGEDGMLADEKGKTVFGLTAGIYHLVETKAPDGYNLKTEAVVIEIGSGNGSNTGAGSGVSYSEGTNLSSNGNGISYNEETEVYTFLISDTAGQELPHTGGPGTTVIYLAGIMLIVLSLFGLSVRRKKSE